MDAVFIDELRYFDRNSGCRITNKKAVLLIIFFEISGLTLAQCEILLNRMNVETKITETRNPNEIFCRRLRCRCFLGELVEDGQAISIGNVRVWHVAVLTCSQCFKPYRFQPKTLTEDLFSLETLQNDYNF